MQRETNRITLNYNTYPLVVGNADKYNFEDWENCGSTVQLEAFVEGAGALAEDEAREPEEGSRKSADVTWKSEDESVAVVDRGLVRARTTGVTSITASLPSGEKAKCLIAVIDNITRSTVLRMELNTQELLLEPGKSAQLKVIMYPEDILGNGAMNRTVTFRSLDESIAQVDKDGTVTGMSEGETVITATSNDVGRTADCRITVASEVTMKKSASAGVQMKSTNPYIADVDSCGKISVYSAGHVDILTTQVGGGSIRKIGITVSPEEKEPERIFFNRTQLYMKEGSRECIYALAAPAWCCLPEFEWFTDSPDIVEICSCKRNPFGGEEVLLCARDCGTALVRARLGGREAVCSVHVMPQQPEITSLELEEIHSLQMEEVRKIRAEYDSRVTHPGLFWISTDRECITVDREGILKAGSAGTARIYCVAGQSVASGERYQLWKLSSVRCLEKDSGQMKELEKILAHAVYGERTVTVDREEAGQNCLRWPHIPQESVTSDSISLLWGRASLLDTGEFARYQAACWKNESLVETVTTQKLGHTFRRLEPDTVYRFRISALDRNGEELAERTLEAATRPFSPVIDVTCPPFLASGSGRVMDTMAIQAAIDSCPPGGTVLLPEDHVFYSGALFLKSHMTFQVDGILIGSTDPKDYPPMVTRWEGWRKLPQSRGDWANSTQTLPENRLPHSSLLNAGVYDEGEEGAAGPYNVEDLVICGKGMINGNGFKLGYHEGPNHHDKNGGRPVPFSTQLDPTLRGRAITLHNAQNVYIKDVTVCYSPSWTIHTIYCDHVTFDHLQVVSKGTGRTGAADDICILNGDGIDPDSSTNINIFDCCFFAGDDAVAVKSGRNREGNELNKPTAYLRVTDCSSIGSKGGFCIGSEQAAGAHDILWQNLLVKDVALFGLWIKSSASRGGLVQDVVWRDCVLEGTQGAVFLEDAYRSSDANPSNVLPEICFNVFENIRCVGENRFGIRVVGLPDSYIHDIVFRGVSFEEIPEGDGRAFEITCGQNIVLREVELPKGHEWLVDDVSTIVT